MRNQTKIKQLLIAHLEAIISKQGHIILTAENVKSIIGGAINRCYEADMQVNKISLNVPVISSVCDAAIMPYCVDYMNNGYCGRCGKKMKQTVKLKNNDV